MKPVPPSEVIAEYQAAFTRCNGRHGPQIEYIRGWYRMVSPYGHIIRYRGAQIIHMTATLNERAKAKG